MLMHASGRVYKTLGNEPMAIYITSSAAQLEFGIFDANVGGMWDSVNKGKAGLYRYSLYADPTKMGVPGALTLLNTYFSTDSGAVDNGWYAITRAHAPEAEVSATGQYVYLLVVSQDSATAEAINDFKVGANGEVSVAPNIIFGLEGAVNGAFTTIWPNYPGSFVPTTYDGNWALSLSVEATANEDVNEVTVWDGDLDYGDGVSTFDTDDPDTPNELPSFANSPDTVAEGAKGAGNPKENNPNLGGVFARGGAITYVLTDTIGATFVNSNPSGDQEWEKFTIRRKLHPDGCTVGVNADFCVDAITPGDWQMGILGLDLSNSTFFRFEVEVSAGGASNGSIGNTVFFDKNGNGRWDSDTEAGINGVTLMLTGDTDGDGVIDTVRFATTADRPAGPGVEPQSGYYSFGNLPAGTYTVQVIDSNFASGGQLAGHTQTLDKTFQAADHYNRATAANANAWQVTLATDEAYTRADFGYIVGGFFCVEDTPDDGILDDGAYVTTVIDQTSGTMTIRISLYRSHADTAYGNHSKISYGGNWPQGSGRPFRQIWLSDLLRLQVRDGAGTVMFNFELDLLADWTGVIPSQQPPSGYVTSGIGYNLPTGIRGNSQNGTYVGTLSDGSAAVGDPTQVQSVRTSISENLNTLPLWGNYDDSPRTLPGTYQLDLSDPYTAANLAAAQRWDWDTWYEITLNLAAFGANGVGTVEIPFLHSSPSKTNQTNPSVAVTTCPPVEPGI